MNSFNVVVSCLQREVSGSSFMMNISFPDGKRYNLLVDFGLFQEKKYQNLNTLMPNISVSNINAVLITHDHCDHDGRLPYLVKQGYSNPICVTPITKQYLQKSLEISVNISKQQHKKNKKKCNNGKKRSSHSELDLTSSEVLKTMEHIVPVNYRQEFRLSENVYFTFYENGHMPGAAMIFIKICFPGCENKYYLFTGDYNDKNTLFDVKPLPKELTDLPINIFVESTYGSQLSKDIQPQFADNLVNALKNGCSVIEFCLSKNRIYEPFKIIADLQKRKIISTKIPIYIDGPSLIYYFKKDCEIFKDRVVIPENVNFIDGKDDRNRILYDKSCKIIFTTSGMGSFGPAPAYIAEYIEHQNAMLHFNSYCAKDTFGERLKNVAYGQTIPFRINNCGPLIRRADIQWTAEFSGHGKFDQILKLLRPFTNIKAIFVQHGELNCQQDTKYGLIHELNLPEEDVIVMKPDVYYKFCSNSVKQLRFTK